MNFDFSFDRHNSESILARRLQITALIVYSIFTFIHVVGPSRLIVLHPEIGGRLTLISKVCLLVLILLSLPAVVKSKKNIFYL